MKNRIIKSMGAAVCAAAIAATPVYSAPPEQKISANIVRNSDEPGIMSNTLLPGTSFDDMLYYTGSNSNAAEVGLIAGTTKNSYASDINGEISFYIDSDSADCLTVDISLEAKKQMLMRAIIKPRSFNSYTVYNLIPGETYKFDIKSMAIGRILMY